MLACARQLLGLAGGGIIPFPKLLESCECLQMKGYKSQALSLEPFPVTGDRQVSPALSSGRNLRLKLPFAVSDKSACVSSSVE